MVPSAPIRLGQRDPLERHLGVRELRLLLDVGRTGPRLSVHATFTFQGASAAWAGPVGPTWERRGSSSTAGSSPLSTHIDPCIQPATSSGQRRWPMAGNTPVIRVLGTVGRPTVAVDGLYVLRGELGDQPWPARSGTFVSCRPSWWSPPDGRRRIRLEAQGHRPLKAGDQCTESGMRYHSTTTCRGLLRFAPQHPVVSHRIECCWPLI